MSQIMTSPQTSNRRRHTVDMKPASNHKNLFAMPTQIMNICAKCC